MPRAAARLDVVDFAREQPAGGLMLFFTKLKAPDTRLVRFVELERTVAGRECDCGSVPALQ